MFPNPAYRHTAPPWPIVVLCVSHNPKKAPGPPLRLNRQAHGTSSWLAIAQGLYQKIIGAKPEFLLPSQPSPPPLDHPNRRCDRFTKHSQGRRIYHFLPV